METVFMVFMAFVSLICLFSVLVVLRDIIREVNQSKQQNVAQKEEKQEVEEKKPVVVEEPKVEVVEQPKEENNSDDSVIFTPANPKTLDEKYLELSAKEKAYYDEIVKYAASIEGSKRVKNAKYEEYKLGNTKLVRLIIKRNVVIGQVVMTHGDFKNYLAQNKISDVKIAPTNIKISSKEDVQVVKDSIDIVVNIVKEEKEAKKQLQRERRKNKNKVIANQE